MLSIIPSGAKSAIACTKHLKFLNPDALIRGAVRKTRKLDGLDELLTGVDAADKLALKDVFKGTKSSLIVTPHDHAKGIADDAELTNNMITVAVEQGVQYIVLIGSWTVKEPLRLSHLANRFLGPEQTLKNLEISHGLKWTVLRGGYFLENFLPVWAPMIKAGKPVTNVQTTLAPVATEDIGKCAAVCLSEGPQKHHGKHYSMNGPEMLTIQEIAEKISKTTGKNVQLNIAKYDKVRGPPYFKQLVEYLEKEGRDATPFTRDVENLLGQSTSLDSWLIENKKYFG
jgi:uncharacterized protein YbjT (DUF2867 family)